MAKQHTQSSEEQQEGTTSVSEQKPHCGIIMPLSDTAGYDSGHWQQVQQLIIRAADKAGFTAGMVSENEGQDMIHASIIKNIYHNPVVVCDVSSLNPNVMLELGLRMATKKPLILIFDSADTYPFDIKNFIYAGYPKGLHFFRIEQFVNELADKIKQVYEADKQSTYKPYLSHFNDVVIEASKLDVSTQTITDTLLSLVDDVKGLKADFKSTRSKDDDATIRAQDVFVSVPLTITEKQYISFKADDIAKKHPNGKGTLFVVQLLLDSIEEGFETATGLKSEVARKRYAAIYPAVKDYAMARLNKEYSQS